MESFGLTAGIAKLWYERTIKTDELARLTLIRAETRLVMVTKVALTDRMNWMRRTAMEGILYFNRIAYMYKIRISTFLGNKNRGDISACVRHRMVV